MGTTAYRGGFFIFGIIESYLHQSRPVHNHLLERGRDHDRHLQISCKPTAFP